MKAWPWRQECRGHDTAKKICCADEACSIGKVCTNPLLRTVCSASNLEMKSKKRKKIRINTQAVAGMNSQIRISEFSDSEQHHEADKEAKRVTRRPGKPGKKQTPEEEVGRYRSSSVTPDSQPHFLSLVRGIRTQYPHLCRELVTLLQK